jgi:hypothetical protein
MSLIERCVSIIVEHDLIYTQKVGEYLEKMISEKEVLVSCGSTVTTRLRAEERLKVSGWEGFLLGINSANQCKEYVYFNARCCENDVDNYGWIGSAYILYYLKQEQGFFSWYKHQCREKRRVNYDRCAKFDLYVLYEMTVI